MARLRRLPAAVISTRCSRWGLNSFWCFRATRPRLNKASALPRPSSWLTPRCLLGNPHQRSARRTHPAVRWLIKQHLICNFGLSSYGLETSPYLRGCGSFSSRQNSENVPGRWKTTAGKKSGVRVRTLNITAVSVCDPVACFNYCLGKLEALETPNPLPDVADNITEPW